MHNIDLSSITGGHKHITYYISTNIIKHLSSDNYYHTMNTIFKILVTYKIITYSYNNNIDKQAQCIHFAKEMLVFAQPWNYDLSINRKKGQDHFLIETFSKPFTVKCEYFILCSPVLQVICMFFYNLGTMLIHRKILSLSQSKQSHV